MARELSDLSHLILLCGHYEGIDERVYKAVDRRICLGDFVLTGGEIAACAVADSVIRLLPGVLKEAATRGESFENGLLEYPQYTQPADLDGDLVPPVLLSGDHEKIRKWRLEESLRATLRYRPDLLRDRPCTPKEQAILERIRKEKPGERQ
jgi:tRNA (guanine37-N1)-methyltransferase